MGTIRGLSVVLAAAFVFVSVSMVQPARAYICGDGVLQLGEQCDQGSQNSDTQPNACRTDCRFAYCGDGIIDYGEQCDDGQGHNGDDPNSCRENCRLPVCGDGIHDDGSHGLTVFNEECDDGNTNDHDGCKQDCTTCLLLTNNINISADTKLCANVFAVDDYGPEGVIILQYPGITLDCAGATLQGAGGNAGIYVMQASNVTIRNCTVTGYDVGIKVVDSSNVSIMGCGNHLSGNTKPFLLENSQLAPPQAVGPSIGGNLGGMSPGIIQQGGDQDQDGREKKLHRGEKPKVVFAPGDSERSKLPGRKPVLGQPGKRMAPLGAPSSGRKGVKPMPRQPGKEGVPGTTPSLGGKTVRGLPTAPPPPKVGGLKAPEEPKEPKEPAKKIAPPEPPPIKLKTFR